MMTKKRLNKDQLKRLWRIRQAAQPTWDRKEELQKKYEEERKQDN